VIEMQTSFIDPRLGTTLGTDHFPSTCTIQTLVETVDAAGELSEAWTNYAGHVDIPCSLNPESGDEIKTGSETYAIATHTISLAGRYPTITASMRAVIGRTAYDILLPMHSGHGLNTRLKCRIVTV